MSTLEYLDGEGTVTSFTLVPLTTLHAWLSELNGNPNYVGNLAKAKGVNRGKVLEELEARRKGKDSVVLGGAMRAIGRDRGYGKDWREYETKQGLTHLEELLVYQPKEWRVQAREYFFRFKCDLDRMSVKGNVNRVAKVAGQDIALKRPVEVVLFHKDMKRVARYEPLNFLLSYDVRDPLPALTKDMNEAEREGFMEFLSPLDYFFEFHGHVASYGLARLRTIGKAKSCPRICLIKELDFSDIIGQRLAKQVIRQSVVSYVYSRDSNNKFCSSSRQPLSMIFAGPSGNGKTELAKWLSKLMNKPAQHDDHFHKVDCGKLTDVTEIFGRSGAYQGAQAGSALNNFVQRLSVEPESIGIVLLDEIEKASKDVVTALYQVFDKGEWTNKRLGRNIQTETIPCHNIIFIMTTNACDKQIQDYADRNEELYCEVGEEFEESGNKLEGRLRNLLRKRYPFDDAFIGRVGRVVPFLPMARGHPGFQHPLLSEMTVVAKVLIEKEQVKYVDIDDDGVVDVEQLIDPETKHKMAKIIVQDAIPEAGVRSIEKLVQGRMGNRLLHSLLLTKGGIQQGSKVEYHAEEDEKVIDFRTKQGGVDNQEEEDGEDDGFEDVYA